MATEHSGGWQFSLRALLLVTLACAALLGIGKLIGFTWVVWPWFVFLLLAPMVMRSKSSQGAWLGALAAVYGPFVGMATYTLFFVGCSHCKETTWILLPFAPGIIPVEFARQWLDLDRPDDANRIAVSFFVAALLVAGLAWVLRTRGRWWQVVGVISVVALSSFGAYVVLEIVRA
jgi:hypothetical protein